MQLSTVVAPEVREFVGLATGITVTHDLRGRQLPPFVKLSMAAAELAALSPLPARVEGVMRLICVLEAKETFAGAAVLTGSVAACRRQVFASNRHLVRS